MVEQGRDFSGPKTATWLGWREASELCYRAGLPAQIPATSPSRELFFPLSALESTSFCHSLGKSIYLSDKYFCDREEETAFLNKQIENGRDVALISPRRIGKSGLIQHFFNQPNIKERYYVFFVDIYATTSLAEFVYTLGKEIYEQLKPQTTIWKEKFFQTITSLFIAFH